ncbi:uncharacterized protein F4822DRAFT_230241 [Hypoxylon trugodes]|uniref:uncharacterized protein n=1 Tax=Hypoxylon trugodes TaxID=326681 RepID=UPI0021921A60|nr:uncharacterized protein F4822DRAFT_230241 [Hypoxylon trugodes]KAI1390245.1 hypothetical protein F4822DRAFT_230241 [Hypoxylon trugodes]
MYSSDLSGLLKETVRSLVTRLDITHVISEQGFSGWRSRQKLEDNSQPLSPVKSQTLLSLDMDDCLRDLARKIIEQSDKIDPSEFPELWVLFVGGILDVLKNRPISSEDPVISSLVQTIIKLYWTRYVTVEEPGPEVQRHEILLPCKCNFCKALNIRLASRTMNEWKFMSRERKQKNHVDDVLRGLSRQNQCSYTCFQVKGCCTWSITVTPTEYEKAKAEWERRVTHAGHQFAAFDQVKLRKVLGQEDYHSMTSGEMLLSRDKKSTPKTIESPRDAQAQSNNTVVMPQISPPPGPDPTSRHHITNGLPSTANIPNVPVHTGGATYTTYYGTRPPPNWLLEVRQSWHANVIWPTGHHTSPPTTSSLPAQNTPAQLIDGTNIHQSERAPLASFSQNLTQGLGPGLKRKQSDDCIIIDE